MSSEFPPVSSDAVRQIIAGLAKLPTSTLLRQYVEVLPLLGEEDNKERAWDMLTALAAEIDRRVPIR